MIELTPAERRALKQRAHPLRHIVSTGNAGLTQAVLNEMASSLAHHELMKIRVLADDRSEREATIVNICQALDCARVQQVGFVVTLYRPNPEKQRAEAKKAAAQRKQSAAARNKKPKAPARAKPTAARSARAAAHPAASRSDSPWRAKAEPSRKPRDDAPRPRTATGRSGARRDSTRRSGSR